MNAHHWIKEMNLKWRESISIMDKGLKSHQAYDVLLYGKCIYTCVI